MTDPGGAPVRRLTRNAVRCRDCGDVIESTRRHHWVSCSCGRVFVDGGLDYSRRGWADEMPEDLCEYDGEDD